MSGLDLGFGSVTSGSCLHLVVSGIFRVLKWMRHAVMWVSHVGCESANRFFF